MRKRKNPFTIKAVKILSLLMVLLIQFSLVANVRSYADARQQVPAPVADHNHADQDDHHHELEDVSDHDDSKSNDIAPHRYTHKHTSDGSEHTHTHPHSNGFAQASYLLSEIRFQFGHVSIEKLRYLLLDHRAIPAPFASSLFRPPIV